ncbi:MAG: STAS domain-containing protein [Xanthomonadaceae bacterium]|jgi:phospholipid transport system transporter-binding protein|nr:STAS domain-containing protein [Xanthomonadaceae bacterium]
MAADDAFRLDRGTPGTLALSGTLGFATAAAALQALTQALHGGDGTQIDLAGVRSSDSAGLACVLAVLAEARGRGQAVSLRHVPEGMRTLARVSGVEALLD